uniref:TF-B3 domain-containing protein n=1 Tax=Aegilops tauschii TaxID=37682 RepID=Q8LL93_AEGTA|nr:unknown [Aegilops tauschii]
MGGSSHRRSASPEYELHAFEFFSVILGTSVSATRLSDTFMNMLGEDSPDNVKLRQAGSGVRRLWDVELVIEEGHMYLCRSWEKFYSAYDLRTEYFLLFRYDDDATMLIVKVFNTTMCRMRYADDEDAGNGSSSSDTGYSQSSSDYGCSKSNSDSSFSERSSDSGSSKDSKKDDPDWSGGEEEQSGDEELQDDDGHQAEDDLALVVADQGQEMVVADHGQEMVVADHGQEMDDLAMVMPVLPEGGLAMAVVPDNDHAPVVAPAIPQLGDMTTPIVVEDYIPQLPPPPRRSWRIRLRKEKEKNNEN